MTLNPDRVGAALEKVLDPNTRKALDVKVENCDVRIDGQRISLTVPLGYPVDNGEPELVKRIETALREEGMEPGDIRLSTKIASHAVQAGLRPLPNVRNIIAVASGKGGIGKSTTSVNVALALSRQGARVGLLDADIYGPSVPIMLGVSEKPKSIENKMMAPVVGHGIESNSIGYLIDEDAPAIWRGPMVVQALEQLLRQTNWRDLDYLIIDMPPGTGDIALTLSQKVPLAGAVIVTTPQDLALADARKGLRMFQKVDVPVLGIVENMSVHVCSNCGHAEPIFGEHGGRDMAAEYHLPWLGALPLAMGIRLQTDSGNPTVVADPEGPVARIYHDIAHKVALQVAALPRDFSAKMPTVVARH